MVCAIAATPQAGQPSGEVESPTALDAAPSFFGDEWRDEAPLPPNELRCETPDDPFEDFEEDDFDDDFDDDFEEDWEDDLTEDEEFPDTFGGEDADPEGIEGDDEESPFADDPDFDD